MKISWKISKLFLLIIFSTAFYSSAQTDNIFKNGRLEVSPNGRYLQFTNGKPFFWLADTGWLLFSKLNREEAIKYLDNRKDKGFNVIQAIVIHSFPEVNVYGDSAFINDDPAKPKVTPGNNPGDSIQYDFWDHVDYIVNQAAERGIFIAMVPVWGSNVRDKKINIKNAKIFANWIAERYKNKPNIIWINGGDTKGGDNLDVWNLIGNTIHMVDPNHLITFHPFGRTESSTWFQAESWLSFNMFQSGHRSYKQDSTGYGEDNWKYVQDDYNKLPIKPTLDGEPSYEGIPYGLHDTTQPRWNNNDVRRYAYWSVFAGACGFTYGNNAVWQMHKPTDKNGAYGVKEFWYNAVNDSGACEMVYLKNLMLSRPYLERVPDQALVAGNNGKKYNYIAATKGRDYLFAYTYNGRKFEIKLGKIRGKKVKAYWYNPRNGSTDFIGEFKNQGTKIFIPPGEERDGNDWVLVVDDASKRFLNPGVLK